MQSRIQLEAAPGCGCARPRPAASQLRRLAHRAATRIDGPLAAIALVLALLAVLAPTQLLPSLAFTGNALIGIAPWLAISVGCATFASVPAAAAVWALAAPRVFALYLGLGVTGSLLAAYAYSLLNGVRP